MSNLNTWSRDLSLLVRATLIIFVVLLFIFIEVILWSRFIADRFYNQAIRYIKRIDEIDRSLTIEKVLCYGRILKLLEKAELFNPRNSNYPFLYAEVIMQININEDVGGLIELPKIKNAEGGYQQAKFKYLRAVSLEPTNTIYHLKLGTYYDLLKDSNRAEREFRYAELFDPTNVGNRVYLTKYFLHNKNEEEAHRHLDKAKKICREIVFGVNSCSDVRELLSIVSDKDSELK